MRDYGEIRYTRAEVDAMWEAGKIRPLSDGAEPGPRPVVINTNLKRKPKFVDRTFESRALRLGEERRRRRAAELGEEGE